VIKRRDEEVFQQRRLASLPQRNDNLWNQTACRR
jgi:hypothetical protein